MRNKEKYEQLRLQYFTYIHCKPNGVPFYVGKGNGHRVDYPIRKNKFHRDILKKYGKNNILIKKYRCDSEKQAFELEKELVFILRNFLKIKLVNTTDGGEGSSGYKADPRDVARRASIHSLNFKGHKVEDNTRARIALTLLNHKRTEESINKTREANLGSKRTEQQRLNMKASKPGLKKGELAQLAAQKSNATKLAKKLGTYISLICSEPGCQKIALCSNLCNAHYGKHWRQKRIKEIGKYKTTSLPHPLKEST